MEVGEDEAASRRSCMRGLLFVPSNHPQRRRFYSCWRIMSTASARLFTYASGFTWGWFSSQGLQRRQKGMAEQGRSPNQVPYPWPSSCCCAHRAQGSSEVAPDGAPSAEPGFHIPPSFALFPPFPPSLPTSPIPRSLLHAMVDPMSLCN